MEFLIDVYRTIIGLVLVWMTLKVLSGIIRIPREETDSLNAPEYMIKLRRRRVVK